MISWNEFEEYIVLSKLDNNVKTNTKISDFLTVLESYFPETLVDEVYHVLNKNNVCIKTFLIGYGNRPDGFHILYNHKVANEIVHKAFHIFEINTRLYPDYKSEIVNIISKYLVSKYYTENKPIVAARYTIL